MSGFRLSLKWQGVLLILVMLCIELAFVGALAHLLKQADEEISRQTRSKEILTEADLLAKTFEDAALSLMSYGISHEPQFRLRYEKSLGEVPQVLSDLLAKIGDHPQEQRSWRRLDELAKTGLKLGRQPDLEPNLSSQQLRKVADNLRDSSRELVQEEKLIAAESPEIEGKARKDAMGLLAVLVGVNVCAAMAFMFYFMQSIVRRLNVLADNSVLLASGKPLKPCLPESDEIAELDQTFHMMADSLAEATRKQRAIFENAVDVICAVDADLRFVEVSQACRERWGYEAQDLIGKRVMEVIAPSDRDVMLANSSELMASGGHKVFEANLVHARGHEVALLWSVSWSGDDRTLFCVAHDQTEQKKVEELKKDFVAMVSHDLRTPLTSLQMLLDSLKEGLYGSLSDHGKHRVSQANLDVQRLINLINGLLEMERLDAGKLPLKIEEVNTQDLIDTAVEAIYSLAQKHKIVLDVQCQYLNFRADGNRLVQVLVNLLSNAIKFSPEGSTIRILAARADGSCEFSVVDSGIGIAEEDRAKIFNRFEQVAVDNSRVKGSSGLGLSICSAIVQEHKGAIGVKGATDCEAQGDSGSTFWFRIPLHADA